MPEVVMAIDPGRAKCGVAIASARGGYFEGALSRSDRNSRANP